MAVPEAHSAVDLVCEGEGINGIRLVRAYGVFESWDLERHVSDARSANEERGRQRTAGDMLQAAAR